VLANVFGYWGLAGVLGRGVLMSVYLALLLYGALRVGRAMVHLFLRSRSGRSLGMVRTSAALIEGRLVRGLDVVALGAWVVGSLGLFFGFEDLAAGVSGVLGATARFGAIEVSLGGVLGAVLMLAAALAASRFLRFVLAHDVLPRLRVTPGAQQAVSTTLHYAVIAAGAVLALGLLGVDLNRFGLLAGALGVGLGFGLQNVVNNFVSGLILLFERPVQVGDTVELGNLAGEVRRIGIRASTIRTFDGADVIVPNANLISDRVVNWTHSDRLRRMDVRVGVAYGSDPERVMQILRDVARAHPDVLEEPPPVAVFQGFGESALDFALFAWAGRFERWFVARSELHVAVNSALRDAGIEIPFPQREVRVRGPG
jgi:small-conductance mechanosensitive channel